MSGPCEQPSGPDADLLDHRFMRVGALVWFAFVSFPVFSAFGEHNSPVHLTAVLVTGACFLALWLRVVFRPREAQVARTDFVLIGVLALMATGLTLLDGPAWIGLFPFVAVRGAIGLPTRLGLRVVIGTAVFGFAFGLLAGANVGGAVTVLVATFGLGVMLINLRSLREANHRLVAARDEVARLAVADERLRFARDLHDLLGHSLTVIAVKSELAGRLIGPDPARAAAEIAEITDSARRALGDVRAAVTGYRLLALDDELAGAATALSAAGIEPSVSAEAVVLPSAVEATLAWAVREGTTNVLRHSGAQRCQVCVMARPGEASVEIVDDGRAPAAIAEGNGLRGLRERVEQLGGRVEAWPRSEGGFRLRVLVPVAVA